MYWLLVFFCLFAHYTPGEKKLREVVVEIFQDLHSQQQHHPDQQQQEESNCVFEFNTKKSTKLEMKDKVQKLTYFEVDVWIPQFNIGFEYQVIWA